MVISMNVSEQTVSKRETIKIGFAVTGSFCTFKKAFEAAGELVKKGYDLTPIMSFNSAGISSRFGTAEEHKKELSKICSKPVIATIEQAEPIGPKKMFDLLVVAPCTSNTLAKLALGVNDTPVTMAVKSHLRNQRPVVIAVSTNDALTSSAKNIGALLNYKNFYFVPYGQDEPVSKPASMIADFSMLLRTVENALVGKQLTPIVKESSSF